MLNPYYEEAGITIYHGDCREILPHLPKVDFVLTDPPYGIGEAAGKNKSRGQLAQARDYGCSDWDDHPPAEMRAARTKEGKRCKCGKRIGDRSNVCRACNAPSMRKAKEPQPTRELGFRVFSSLRGPGGELDAKREQGRPYSRRRGQSGATV